MEKLLFEKPNFNEVPAKTTSMPDKPVYRARPKRDRVITAIPEILWKAGESEHGDEGGSSPKKADLNIEQANFHDANTGVLDVKILELYALAEEYALEPSSFSALERSERINDIAQIKDVDDNAYLENLAAIFEHAEKIEADGASQIRGQTYDAFNEAIAAHKQCIKAAILDLMSDPAVRSRYLSEISGERSIRRAPETRIKLKEILQLRALQNRLQEEQRRLRIEEFLAREEGAGKPRHKSPGRTPQALRNLERGIALAQAGEIEKSACLTAPERGLLAAELLLQRKNELEEKGFVLSPSRERLISEIIELTAQGYRIFLGGPTGTGKTSTALFALKEMTGGSYSWVTWTGETSVRDLFGSPKLATTAEGRIESGMTKGPVTRAVVGELSGVLHEEFTSGQTGVQMSMKTLWAARPGEQINLPGFNGAEFTKSELIELATGNLKGKRHQEREAVDPAVAREFKAIEVPFMPSDETRDYLILPILIDRAGVMPLNRKEIEMVTQICRAAELSQLAYLEEIPKETRESDFYKVVSPSGEPIALTNVFLDTGTVKDLFFGWRASGKPLVLYLQEGLRRFIEQNPHFKENKIEQVTLKNILRAYGLNLDAKNANNFFAASRFFKTTARSYLKPSELNFFIHSAPPSEEDEFNSGGAEDQQKEKTEPIPETRLESSFAEQIKTAREILGEREVFGPEEIKKAYGIELKPEEIPGIPFPVAELQKARELGQFLILRVGKDSAGKPLNMEGVRDALLAAGFDESSEGKITVSKSYDKKYWEDDPIKTGWALVSKEVIPDSTNKDYFEQTKLLADYVRTKVFSGSLKKEYAEAIAEFKDYTRGNSFDTKSDNDRRKLLGGSDWKKYAEELENLKINELTRQIPAEALYDIFAYYRNNNEKILENEYTWTWRRYSVGSLVNVGKADAGGAFVYGWGPDYRFGYLGVSFSRSL